MAIWKEELYGTRRCVNCGFLGKRSPEIDEVCFHASGMGSRAQELFRQNRIKVIINVLESNPEKVVLDYIGGGLEVGDDVCDH